MEKKLKDLITPGKWVVGDSNKDRVISGTGHYVAFCNVPSRNKNFLTQELKEANAKAISLVPDMLELIEKQHILIKEMLPMAEDAYQQAENSGSVHQQMLQEERDVLLNALSTLSAYSELFEK